MYYACFGPKWFFGCDIATEFLFFIISLVVGLMAFKIYRMSNQKNIRAFGMGFLFISAAYLIQTIFNFVLINMTDMHDCAMMKLNDILLFDSFAVFSHVILMTVGLLLIASTALKCATKREFWLLFVISIVALVFAKNVFQMFFWLSAVFLIFISGHYIQNYRKVRRKHALIIAVAFVFMIVGNLNFIFSSNNPLFYVVAHLFEFVAYTLILWNFYLIHKKNKK